jgi:hypothetical protein
MRSWQLQNAATFEESNLNFILFLIYVIKCVIYYFYFECKLVAKILYFQTTLYILK